MDNQTAMNTLGAAIPNQQVLLDAMNVAWNILKTGFISDQDTITTLQAKIDDMQVQLNQLNASSSIDVATSSQPSQ